VKMEFVIFTVERYNRVMIPITASLFVERTEFTILLLYMLQIN